jgi:predicted membrane protein (TIGR00267 family)
MPKVFHELEGVAFGLTDEIILFLGIIIGVAAATANPLTVIIAALVGGITNAFSSSVGVFVAQSTERGLQLRDQKLKIKTRVHSKQEVFRISAFSFVASILAVMVLISPFFLFDLLMASAISATVAIILLFALGYQVGAYSEENSFRTGFKYAALGIIGAVFSHIIGLGLHAVLLA